MSGYIDANREAWDIRTEYHITSDLYDIEGFKAGKNKLRSIELAELGDVQGKSLLHLQCHFGLDTLSWARLGARVTGVDLSPKSIEMARSLSAELSIPAHFVCADLALLREVLEGSFDIVFTSYGVLGYLSDLANWGQTIAHFLKPGGTFYIVEFHPMRYVFDEDRQSLTADGQPELRVGYPYFYMPEPERTENTGSYAGGSFNNVLYVWNHSMGEIVNSLVKAGLRIEFLNEHRCDPVPHFQGMEQGEDHWWRWKHPLYREAVPLLFSLKATKA